MITTTTNCQTHNKDCEDASSASENKKPSSSEGTKTVVLFLDLDDTLYDKSSGVSKCVSDRMAQYLEEKLNIKDGAQVSYDLYKKYGTTIRGLTLNGYKIEPLSSFYDYCHTGFDYEGKLKKNDQQLINLLTKLRNAQQLKQVKSSTPTPSPSSTTYEFSLQLFTNSDLNHARKIFQYIGVKEEWFDGITSFEDLELNCKPESTSFEIAMKKAHILQKYLDCATKNLKDSDAPIFAPTICHLISSIPEEPVIIDKDRLEIYFVDDSVSNVKAAKRHGWFPVHVNEAGDPSIQTELQKLSIPTIKSIYELESVLPQLFN